MGYSRRSIAGYLAGTILGLAVLLWAPAARAQSFTGSEVVMRDGNPTLLVDGRPFFFYGAAFFYERMPPEQWRASMLALRTLGFNTLDLYVPWNWHEVRDGQFDFDGHTNPRRDLRTVLALARELRFKLIVRPGPVIRNEWRNGGYPAWLLTRPEYGMPAHDVLEGRYPATATLQNANSDDAAEQWLANPTHMSYASRWLRTALREFTPVADEIVAVQLDDDQGAYIDNQTWPAPHLTTYLRTLESIVRGVVGARLPVFINTYEMKVSASAPVWAMGNWYQSDAYSIGEHDRAALEFSTGLLQTQTRFPVALSEFQAGWLAPPEDPTPRPADPTNTTLALHTLVSSGARGVIDFPAQDTRNPAGWEAPFANAAYRWDAALDVNLMPSARYVPTARFGEVVRNAGAALADARRIADGAIAYLTSAYDQHRQTNADVFAIVARTQGAQQACRARHLTCDLVDLRFAGDALLRRYPFIIVPRDTAGPPFIPAVEARLARYYRAGGRIVARPPDVVTPRAGGIPDATLLLARDGTALLDILNYDAHARMVPATRIQLPDGREAIVGPLTIPARDAVLLRDEPSPARRRANVGTFSPLPTSPPRAGPRLPAQLDRPGAAMPPTMPPSAPDCAAAFAARRGSAAPIAPVVTVDDRAADGYARVTLSNGLVTLTIAPHAGARAFRFALAGSSETCADDSVFTSVGALRDDVAVQPPLSTTDRIGKYTRSFPAGMFNRDYTFKPSAAAASARAATGDSVATAPDGVSDVAVTFRYDAPDVTPNGASFKRVVRMSAGSPGFTVTERVLVAAGPGAAQQRALRYDSFDARGATTIDERERGGIGFFYPAAGIVATVTWPAADVEAAKLLPERTSTVLRLQFAPNGDRRTHYAIEPAAGLEDARAALLKEREATSANR